ncbi:MAG TPA: hypothetical protein VGN49_03760 [Micrococcaceae bacterium]|jgi:hypothetical protein|nr:hypothetical protein [Micrococcaceae bacterium]
MTENAGTDAEETGDGAGRDEDDAARDSLAGDYMKAVNPDVADVDEDSVPGEKQAPEHR